MTTTTLPQSFNYNSKTINNRGEMLSLTDMWKAAGSPDNKRPDDWKKDSSNRSFIAHVSLMLNTPEKGIWKGIRGNKGGTWAHWHIALAYAKYLSHEFHVWCNTVVRERMEKKQNLTPLWSQDKETIESITRNNKFLIIRNKHLEAEIASLKYKNKQIKASSQDYLNFSHPGVKATDTAVRELIRCIQHLGAMEPALKFQHERYALSTLAEVIRHFCNAAKALELEIIWPKEAQQ